MSGAYIDMKNTELYLEDGYTEAGAVNNASGYSIGATMMLVDAIAGQIPVGVYFYLTGDDTAYVVTSTVETSSNTTTINFTPALTAAVIDNQVFNVHGRRFKIKVGDGNTTYDEKVAREYKKDRGLLDQVRNGDQDPIDVNMSFAWTYLSSDSTATTPEIEEVLQQLGVASVWLTTGGACEPYCVDLVFVNKVPGCGSSTTQPWEIIRLKQFRYESLAHDPKTGLVTVTGKCNILKAMKTRVAIGGY